MNSEHGLDKYLAIIALTIIAVYAIYKLPDCENIVINVIVSVGSFVGGVAVGKSQNKKNEEIGA